MKKLSKNSAFKSESEAIKFLNDLAFNKVTENINKDINLEEIFGESNDNLKLMDKWIEKQLLGNPEITPYNKRPYPYKKYHMIDELLRKHGKEFVKKMRLSLPHNIRKDSDEDSLIDSLAWVIWNKKLDPKSIMPDLPEFGSMWDRISENGYKK